MNYIELTNLQDFKKVRFANRKDGVINVIFFHNYSSVDELPDLKDWKNFHYDHAKCKFYAVNVNDVRDAMKGDEMEPPTVLVVNGNVAKHVYPNYDRD